MNSMTDVLLGRFAQCIPARKIAQLIISCSIRKLIDRVDDLLYSA